MFLFYRLDQLNIAWVRFTKEDVPHVVKCLPHSLRLLNLSGCRENMLDNGKSTQQDNSEYFLHEQIKSFSLIE